MKQIEPTEQTVDFSDPELDALLFDLLDGAQELGLATQDSFPQMSLSSSSAANSPKTRTLLRTFGAFGAAAVAVVIGGVISSGYVFGNSKSDGEPTGNSVYLATEPAEFSAADINPQLLAALTKGKDYSGLVAPNLAAACLQANAPQLAAAGQTTEIFGSETSSLESVVGATPVRFQAKPRQLFVVQNSSTGTHPNLLVLVTEGSCGQLDSSGSPHAATVQVTAVS